MGEVKLGRCPVCGRNPKMKIVGNHIRVRCKPWYKRKAHLCIMVEARGVGCIFARKKAIERWNKAADCANALLEKECCGRISGDDVCNAPTIDAVEVVRCKDCVHRGDYIECPMCGKFDDHTVDDGYCQYGSTTLDEDE